VIVQPAGSGGYGDPLDRERERVVGDIADGYISAEAARRLYKVELDETPALAVAHE
jgi:N-methylhydantoinase B